MTALVARLYAFVALAATLPLLTYGAPAERRATVDYTLRLKDQRINPDGNDRVAVTVNGQMPGPLIKANKGDTMNINVIDEIQDKSMWQTTSIHWHGLHMYNKNYNDGAAMVTQCPIIPGNAFQYVVPTGKQAGTFWYHSHFSTQYCDGVRGPLVVYDPNDPHKGLYDIDDESTIISIHDWHKNPGKAWHPDPILGLPPFPTSTLINGKGIKYPTANPLDLLSRGEHSIISVKKGTRYRMRLINMSCELPYRFSIDGHTLKVIEADSILTKPIDVDAIDIHAGQRYSFVLTTKRSLGFFESGNFWIRTLPIGLVAIPNYVGGVNTAILRYEGSRNAWPSLDPTIGFPLLQNVLKESDLEPLIPNPVPGPHELGKADIVMKLHTVTAEPGGALTLALDPLGNHPFKPPSTPVLLQILNGVRDPAQLDPTGNVHLLPANKTVEITLPGDIVAGPHPFHLHGHDFWVVKSADGVSPKWTNAIMRDTVNAGRLLQSTTIRFRTDNPGPWFLHCHIDWHLEAGLAVVFAEDPESTQHSQEKPPPAWNDLCPIYNNWKKTNSD